MSINIVIHKNGYTGTILETGEGVLFTITNDVEAIYQDVVSMDEVVDRLDEYIKDSKWPTPYLY
jgi:hypothetical protein